MESRHIIIVLACGQHHLFLFLSILYLVAWDTSDSLVGTNTLNPSGHTPQASCASTTSISSLPNSSSALHLLVLLLSLVANCSNTRSCRQTAPSRRLSNTIHSQSPKDVVTTQSPLLSSDDVSGRHGINEASLQIFHGRLRIQATSSQG